ncbi:PorT family protein [Marivirga sp. S37H4]|uniref:PorT family protein n=1 Tax=Marivirga aurantiaca TaxID=2802615 RepID=A0A934X199_9BACT|nr:outer membrane beta-barrel protein [Marivirga aurantiaca]MBK6267128.1 PorT family protein [Marivirga aurantiaca]
MRNARNYYEEGRLQLLPQLLNECIDNGFSKEEKIEALRLVTLSHLFSEEESRAEKSFLKLLRLDPEYKVNKEADPTELILLSERFDTAPKFFWGINGGAAYNLVQVMDYQTINIDLKPGTYEFTTSLGGGLFFQYPINDKFSANIEAHYVFRQTILDREGTEGAAQSEQQSVTERHTWVEFPLLINYKLPVNNFLLEATAGPSFHYLQDATFSLEGRGENINNKDILDNRNVFNMSALAGARANFKVFGPNYFTVALLFQYRLFDEVSQSTGPAFTNDEQNTLLLSGYKDGNYKGHALWLKVGFRFPYFNPKLK